MNITLIIATYNRGEAIAKTIRSVIEQKLKPNEIIVVDDGSTDDTYRFVRSRFPQVRTITKPNGGTSSARNFGAAHASYPWLIFLDHDDLLHPHAIQTLADLNRLYPEAASLHADHIYDGQPDGPRYENHHYTLPPFQRLLNTKHLSREQGSRLFNRDLYHALLHGNLLQQPFAIQKDLFFNVGGYQDDIKYCEDWDLYLRVTNQFPIAVSDKVISTHIIDGGNLHLAALELQDQMYERVLSRRLKEHRFFDIKANYTARRKLAELYKSQGDREKTAGEHGKAIRTYLRSALSLPNDYVVLTRIIGWAIQLGLPKPAQATEQ